MLTGILWQMQHRPLLVGVIVIAAVLVPVWLVTAV